MTPIELIVGRRTILAIIVIAMLVANVTSAADENTPRVRWPENAHMQAAFDRIASAPDVDARRAAIEAMAIPRQNRAESVRQLVVFAARAEGMQKAAVFAAVVGEQKLSEHEIVAAIIPMLELADGPHRAAAINILGQYENRSASRPPDFSMYRDHIAAELRAGRQPPPGLVRYVYDVSPGVALLAMLRAHPDRRPQSLKSVLWAEHVVSDTLWKHQHGFLPRDKVEAAAKMELEKLSRDDRWWVRLYVAAIMRKHDAFRDDAITERLSNDPHGLVKAFAPASQPQP